MRKMIALLLALISVFNFTACGDKTESANAGTEHRSYKIEQSEDSQSDVTETTAKTETTPEAENAETDLIRTEEPAPDTTGSSVVYMTTDISSESLMKIYAALGREVTGENIAVKVSTGEPPASNYLDPQLIKDLVQSVNGTIVECNTAYGGSRSETAMHYQVAEDHGFTEIADVVIMDEDGSIALPVEGGEKLTENYVGAHFSEYDGFLILSHFKGHSMAGFGGSIKNISLSV